MTSILLYGFIEGLLIALMSLAFQLVYRGFRFFDLSLAATYTISAYSFIFFYSILMDWGLYSSISIIVLASFFSFTSTFLFSFFLARVIYKKFLGVHASSLVMLIASLCIFIISINLIALLSGNEVQRFEGTGGFNEPFVIFNIYLTYIQIFQFTISGIFLFLILLILYKTKVGMYINAYSENDELFKLLGLSEFKTKFYIILLSSILICVSSLLKTLDVAINVYSNGFHVVLLAAVSMILGGITSFLGVVIGGISLGLLMNFSTYFISGDWKDFTVFFILILVLSIRRNGLLDFKLRLEG